MQVPLRDLAAVARITVHFGGHIGGICRGMTQSQVARLFACQLVCVRGFCVLTGNRLARFKADLSPEIRF